MSNTEVSLVLGQVVQKGPNVEVLIWIYIIHVY